MTSDYVNKILCEGHIEAMSKMDDKSIDLILTDPPYGTTSNKWDLPFDLQAWWEQCNRICCGMVVMTSSQPFTSKVVISNPDGFRCEWIWKKSRSGSALTAKYRPVKLHENMLVFSAGKTNRYYPQMVEGKPYSRQGYHIKPDKNNHRIGLKEINVVNTGTRFPNTILDVKQDWSKQQQIHPTQKPVALMEYFIKTYSLPGELVLDPFVGSGTTCVAAANLGRRYVGLDTDAGYVKIANDRMEKLQISSA
jgi:site-specific DNA-methyltransferase (adenine-specific)